MRPHTAQARRSAARRAARQLRRHGITYLVGRHLDHDHGLDWLADIAAHIGSLDPIAIGAGALLEANGHERANVQLTLDTRHDTSR